MVFEQSSNESMQRQLASGQNVGYQSLTALQIRLDMQPLLEQLKVYLSGREVMYQKDEQGNDVAVEVQVSDPKCNRRGVQSLMQRLTLLFSSHFVQGNFSEDRYEAFIEEAHKSLLDAIFNNRYNWDIDVTDLDDIIDTIILSLIGFASRLINNEERKSYESTVRTIESTNIQERTGGGFNLFGGKKNN